VACGWKCARVGDGVTDSGIVRVTVSVSINKEMYHSDRRYFDDYH